MSQVKEAPAWFVLEMRKRFPDFVSVEWNQLLSRWSFCFLSAANKPVHQFLGVTKNPLTGQAIEPDPVTGLLPFKDLTIDSMQEVLKSCEQTYIGNRYDGTGSQKGELTKKIKYNKKVHQAQVKDRANTYADMISEIGTYYTRVKNHEHSKRQAKKFDQFEQQREATLKDHRTILEESMNEAARSA
jgi:hypothetical protein